MNRFRRWLRARQDGNAVLFSLIIMASAMTISLGMASLVVGEIHSVALVLPSERAYYRAESYVEQALWQKKQDPNYEFTPTTDATGQVNPPVGQQLPADYLCNAIALDPPASSDEPVPTDEPIPTDEPSPGQTTTSCLSPPPPATQPSSDQATLLKEFFAASSLQQPTVKFTADVPQQFDVATTGTQVKDGSGTIKLDNITGAAGYRGLEVTIIAYPTASTPPAQFPVDNPTTAVFVDKIVIPDGQHTATIPVNTGQQNPAGESYPALDSSNVYRLRIRALGADASADLGVVNAAGNALTLRSSDFTIRSVAADGNAQRGIQVVVPAAVQVASVFDFVLFSDLDLTKLQAKAAGTKLITATAYQDANNNCVKDVSDPPLSGVSMTAHPSSGSESTATTDSTGVATFANLQSGMNYTVTATLPLGGTACTPPGNPQTVTFTANNTNEAKALTYLIKAPLTAGPNWCTLAQDVDIVAGNQGWKDENNGCAEDNNTASVSLISSGQKSKLLRATKFNFAIPPTATIAGITAEIKMRQTGGATDYRVRIVKANAATGTNQAAGGGPAVSGTLAYRTFGGPANLWGTTWTPADINNTGFGVGYAVKQTSGSPTVYVDAVRITVYYY